MTNKAQGSFTVGDEEIQFDDVAQDFLRAKIEGMYADAHSGPTPRPPERLKSRIQNFDPTLFKDKKFIDRNYGSKPTLDLNSGFN